MKRPGELTLPLLERWLDGMVTVDDEAIVEAMVRLAERTKLVTEGAGAIAVAALMTGAVEPAAEGATAAILSGGNVDPRLLAAAINRHEITEQPPGPDLDPRRRQPRRPRRPPAGDRGRRRQHPRGLPRPRPRRAADLSQTSVDLVLETRGPEHTAQLHRDLVAAGYEVSEG